MQAIEFQSSNPPAGVDPHAVLESGNILLFPKQCSALSAAQKQLLVGISQANRAVHKNIAYRPGTDKLSGYQDAASGAAVRSALRAYSQWAVEFTGRMLPRYRDQWQLDYASFRPQEEEGRDLPWKKRNDLLHVDAFPSRPTHGGLILRVFTNINPEQNRVWLTSDPFAQLAAQYANDAGLPAIARGAGSPLAQVRQGSVRALRSLGLPLADRSPYDRFMLGFHDYLKSHTGYQQNSVKYRFEFAPEATWMVFTDVVPHAVLSGRYAIEQTFIVGRASLANPGLAPVSILEGISGRSLTS